MAPPEVTPRSLGGESRGCDCAQWPWGNWGPGVTLGSVVESGEKATQLDCGPRPRTFPFFFLIPRQGTITMTKTMNAFIAPPSGARGRKRTRKSTRKRLRQSPGPTLTLIEAQRVLLSRAPPRTSSANCEARTSTPRMPRQSSTPRRQTTMLNSAAPSARKTEPVTCSARLSRMSPGFDLSVHARIPSAINSPSTSGSSYSKPNKVIGR